MAAPIVNMRVPAALLSLIDAKAARLNMSRSEVILDVLQEAFSAFEEEPEPRPRAKGKPPIQRPAPDEKLGAARAALQTAESRTGVSPARLDTSGVAVFKGGKRPAYQRTKAKR